MYLFTLGNSLAELMQVRILPRRDKSGFAPAEALLSD